MRTVLNIADRLYNQIKCIDQAKFGLIREAIKADQTLLHFVLFQSATSYGDVKKFCFEYAKNQEC